MAIQRVIPPACCPLNDTDCGNPGVRRAIARREAPDDTADAATLSRPARAGRPGIVAVNIGANKDSADRIADYAVMARKMAPFSSYLCVNVSSPNTPGLRALQDEGALTALIEAVIVPETWFFRYPESFATLTRLCEVKGIDYGIYHSCTLDSMGHRYFHDCAQMDHGCALLDAMLARFLPAWRAMERAVCG